ncbi:hypothetical protein L2E82_20364 [Cichorium intybus]|uniref:Uncharacterized protein n=1 Tax=Cichorium intybus TaxID=13427 RepID=A0ACB9DTW5_CICIN|nr:hypothetical protein L2E82_20364 [Cichorium intybus]
MNWRTWSPLASYGARGEPWVPIFSSANLRHLLLPPTSTAAACLRRRRTSAAHRLPSRPPIVLALASV